MDRFFPPEWIKDNESELRLKLRKENFEHYQEFCEIYNKLNSHLFNNVPPTTTNILPQEGKPSFFLIESMFFHFMYTYLYKIRNLCKTLNFNFEEGDFVSATVITRTLMETTCCHLYYLWKIEDKIADLSKSPESRGKGMYEITDLLYKSHAGSSFDWEKHHKSGFKPKTTRQLHINDPLRALKKKTGKPIEYYHSLLSEMTHPNFGSNILVIETRGREDGVKYELVLGGGKHSQSLLWFFETLAEALQEIMSLTFDSVTRTKELAHFFQTLTSMSEERWY